MQSSESSFNPRTILCPVDMSPLSDLALKYAHVGAHLFNASLTLLHALHVDYPRYLSSELTSRVLKELEDVKSTARHGLMEHARHILGHTPDQQVPIHFEVADTEPAQAVLQASTQTSADLIVMGTHGYGGFKHWMLGSVTESVLHQSDVPIFIVRQKINDFIDTAQPEAKPRIRRILCPCNLTMSAGHALQVASVLSQRFKARLTVLQILEPGEASEAEALSAWIQNHVSGTTGDIEPVLRHGTAAAQVIDLAKKQNCDLIVIGASQKPFEQGRVMGHTTELVARHAPVPVLAVPSRDQER